MTQTSRNTTQTWDVKATVPHLSTFSREFGRLMTGKLVLTGSPSWPQAITSPVGGVFQTKET